MRRIVCWFWLLLSAQMVAAQSHTLDDYIQQGLHNSPYLFDYQQQKAANAIDSLKVKATFRPQINLTGQVYYAPTIHDYGYDAAITNGANYAAQVSATQQLIMRKSKRVQFQGIDINNQYLTVTAGITELDLRKAITAQYINAYGDYRQMQSTQEVMNLLDDELQWLKPLVERGIYLQTDYLNLIVAKGNQAIALDKAKMQYNGDLYTLNLICGIDDTAFTALAEPNIALSLTYDENNALLLRQYQLDSLKFLNQLKMIDLNYQPHLSAVADGGLLSSNLGNIYKNFGVGIGLNFSMPLYDGRQRKMDYQKIQFASLTSQKYQQYYRKQYSQQIQQLKQQLQYTDSLITETTKQLQLQQDLMDMYKAQLNKGLVHVTDLVLTMNDHLNMKASLIQLQMGRMQIVNQLNYFK